MGGEWEQSGGRRLRQANAWGNSGKGTALATATGNDHVFPVALRLRAMDRKCIHAAAGEEYGGQW